MTRHSNHTNANLLRKPKYVPPVHACVCYKCQTPYQGYGRICPDCSDMEREARDLERMTKNAILETRAQDDGDPMNAGIPTPVICDECGESKVELMNRFEREQFAYRHPDGLHVQACKECCEIESAKHIPDYPMVY